MEWKKYVEGEKIDVGRYMVMSDKYYYDPLYVVYDGQEFIIGPQSHHLPGNLPLSITHYLRIPERGEK